MASKSLMESDFTANSFNLCSREWISHRFAGKFIGTYVSMGDDGLEIVLVRLDTDNETDDDSQGEVKHHVRAHGTVGPLGPVDNFHHGSGWQQEFNLFLLNAQTQGFPHPLVCFQAALGIAENACGTG
jgi:hypothetical protein